MPDWTAGKDYQNNNGNPPYNLSYPTGTTPAATTTSAKVYKLNATSNKTGLGIVLKVMAGDKIDIHGKSYYQSTTTYNNSNSTLLTLADIIGAFTGSPDNAGFGLKGITSGTMETINTGLIPSTFFRGNDGSSSTVPKAYINYVFFDEQFKYAGGNFSRVGSSGTVKNHWFIDGQLQNISVPKNGYLYVYVSNESNADVFFDNLQIFHTRGPILEETHYYPFGLTMAGISSKALLFGNPDNKKKFNSIEHNNDFDLNMYDAFYRNLDPQIGRFWEVDPETDLLESYSPYESMGNNPISNVDPLGDLKTKFGAWWHRVWHGGGKIGQNEFGEWWVSKGKVTEDKDGKIIAKSWLYYGKGRRRTTAAGERILKEVEEEQDIERYVRLGVYQRHETVQEANEATFKNSIGVLLPNIMKGATGGINKLWPQEVQKVIQKIKIQFGNNSNQVYHAFRHTDEMGLARSAVQAAIEEHLPTVASQIVEGKPLNQIIEVAGQKVQYTAYKLPDGTINVGRIHAAN